jgi:hypothetical protein
VANERERGILYTMSVTSRFGPASDPAAYERAAPVATRTRTAESRLGLLGLVGMVLTGLVLCLAAASTNSLLPDSVRPVPSWMAGPFGSTGLYLPSGILIGVLSLMFVSYVLAVRHADRLSPRAALTAIAALTALVLLAPPLFSTDIFSYQGYARMWATYHTNPYVHGPYAISLDPVYSFIGAKWFNTPSVYGPFFTLLTGVLAPVSVAASALAFKAVAAIACLGTVALLWHSARLRGLNPVRGAVLFALNPLVILYGVGGGHNDLLMVLFLSAGVLTLLTHRERSSGALIIVATMTKLTAGLLLPFALASGVELGAGKRRRGILTGGALTATALTAAGVALFGDWPLHLLGTLQKVQGEGDWHSIPGFITSALGWGGIGRIAGLLLGGVFVVVLVWLLRRVLHGEMDWIDGAAWATAAMLITASSVLPWYISWLLPLVALCTDRRLWRVSLVLTGVIMLTTMLAYLPHGTSILGLRLVP